MHALPLLQSSSQLRTFVQAVLFWHSVSSEQQLAPAHCPHWESPALTAQLPPSAPPSPPDEPPPITAGLQTLPSTTTQSPKSGGMSFDEHATIASTTAAALT
jgi:hypothetical protein